jgi:hypothetical protein
MKKSLIKKFTCSIVTLSIALFFLASCSPDDEKDPAVVFTSLEANKTDVFIEEKIILNLVGTGFTDAELGCSNPSVKITKVTSTIYEISSDLAATANVFVTLRNNTYKESKNVALNFYEHGIKNFNTVEGIKVNVDLSSKVLKLLGEPENKSTSTTGTIEYWSYPSKGVLFAILKSTNLVNNINAYSSNFSTTLENGTKVYYKNYPFDIGNGWYINNTNTIMDAVITKLGQPTNKYSSTTDPTSTFRTYRFVTQNMYLGFYGSTEDDYFGKTIRSIILY